MSGNGNGHDQEFVSGPQRLAEWPEGPELDGVQEMRTAGKTYRVTSCIEDPNDEIDPHQVVEFDSGVATEVTHPEDPAGTKRFIIEFAQPGQQNRQPVPSVPNGNGHGPQVQSAEDTGTDQDEDILEWGKTETHRQHSRAKRIIGAVALAGVVTVAVISGGWAVKGFTGSKPRLNNESTVVTHPSVAAGTPKAPEASPKPPKRHRVKSEEPAPPTPEEIAAAQKAAAEAELKAHPITKTIDIPEAEWVSWLPDTVRVWHPTIKKILAQKKIGGVKLDSFIKANPDLVEIIVMYQSAGDPLIDGLFGHQGLTQPDADKLEEAEAALTGIKEFNPYNPKDSLTALIYLLNQEARALRAQTVPVEQNGKIVHVDMIQYYLDQVQAANEAGDSEGAAALYIEFMQKLLPGIASNQQVKDALSITVAQLAAEATWSKKEAKAYLTWAKLDSVKNILAQAATMADNLGYTLKFHMIPTPKPPKGTQ